MRFSLAFLMQLERHHSNTYISTLLIQYLLRPQLRSSAAILILASKVDSPIPILFNRSLSYSAIGSANLRSLNQDRKRGSWDRSGQQQMLPRSEGVKLRAQDADVKRSSRWGLECNRWLYLKQPLFLLVDEDQPSIINQPRYACHPRPFQKARGGRWGPDARASINPICNRIPHCSSALW